jgi:hypothetical protein
LLPAPFFAAAFVAATFVPTDFVPAAFARAASASRRTRRMSASVKGPFTPEIAASFMPCLRPIR